MELLTPRLRLREFVADDWAAVLAYQRDPRYLRYYEWQGRTEDETRRFVGMFLAQQHEQPRTRFQLAVTLRDGGRLIGNAGIRLSADTPGEAEIGYELAPDEWGKGYATEAAWAVVRFGIAELGVHRVTAWTVADNIGSIRVLEKVGFTLQARLPQHAYYKGRHWDVVVYEMTRDE